MENKTTIGWREWLALPGLGIPAIKAKIDTGARTSAIHAFSLETFQEQGKTKVRFGVHPLQKSNIELFCVADVVDERVVTDSGGHSEERYVIQSTLQLGNVQKDIEVTLTNRDNMLFRMLLGRTAMEDDFIVDPGLSFVTGKSLKKVYKKNRSS